MWRCSQRWQQVTKETKKKQKKKALDSSLQLYDRRTLLKSLPWEGVGKEKEKTKQKQDRTKRRSHQAAVAVDTLEASKTNKKR